MKNIIQNFKFLCEEVHNLDLSINLVQYKVGKYDITGDFDLHNNRGSIPPNTHIHGKLNGSITVGHIVQKSSGTCSGNIQVVLPFSPKKFLNPHPLQDSCQVGGVK